MTGPLARINTWYAKPDNELLRREVAWAFSWLIHRRGWVWLIAYVVIQYLVYYIRMWGYRSGTFPLSGQGGQGWSSMFLPIAVSTSFSWPAELVAFVWWIKVLDDRTFAPLSGGRLRDLLVTPARLSSLFPALLAAPIIVSCFFHIAGTTAFGLQTFLRTIFDVEGGLDPGVASVAMYSLGRSSDLVGVMIGEFGFTAFVAVLAFPRGSLLRIVCSMAILWIIYSIIGVLVVWGAFRLMDWLDIWPGSSGPTPSLPFLIFSLCSTVVVGMASVATFALCLRWLRGGKAEAKAREALESHA